MTRVVKNMPANTGDVRDMDLIPGSGRSPGWVHGNTLQYSCLENPMDRRAWWATVHGVTKSQTGLGMHAGGVYKQTFQPPSVLGIRIFYLFSNIMFENMQRILQTKEEHPSFWCLEFYWELDTYWLLAWPLVPHLSQKFGLIYVLSKISHHNFHY